MQIVELPFLVDNANEAGLVVQRLHDAGHQTGLGAVKLLGAGHVAQPSVYQQTC